jgi:hypothetical protein
MSLHNDILNNWSTDIIGFAHSIESLKEQGYPGWTVKYQDSYGVAIPYDGIEEINEYFSNAQIKSDVITVSGDCVQRAVLLLADFSVSRESFAAFCEVLVDPGEDGKNREAIVASPVSWWKNWKEMLGNKNVDEMVYDTLGELLVLDFLMQKGEDVSWGGPDSSTYDIETASGYYEVKSTVKRSKKEITISSQFQLDPPDKSLDLVMCVFEPVAYGGTSIDDTASELVSLGLSGDYLNVRLSRKGLKEGMSARRRRFILHEMLKYKIDESFPKITPASFIGGVIPTGITKIVYTVNLDGRESESLIQGDGNEIQNN